MIDRLETILIILIPVLSFILSIVYSKTRNKSEDDKQLVNFRRKMSFENIESKNTYVERYLKRVRLFLSQLGFNYMFGDIHPVQYIFIRIAFAVFFALVGINILNKVLLIGFVILGYFVPNIVLRISNKHDNEKMIRDFVNIYEAMRTQTRAGVYITSVLCECYKITYSRRLKVALMDLAISISAKNDIEEALNAMTIKFKNKNVDMFAIMINQAMESGQSVQFLSDVSDQLVELKSSLLNKEKTSLELKTQIIEALIFIGIIAIIIYALFSTMDESLLSM